MSDIFYGLYQFIKNRKWLIPLGTVFIFLSCGLALWNTHLEEDITKILPSNEAIKKFNEGFLDSELSNRLVIHLYSEDPILADSLTTFCQLFVDSLLNSQGKNLVKSVTYKINSSAFQELSQNVVNHLPLFLKDEHYAEIEKRIEEEAIEERIFGAYKALISPAGIVFKDIFRKDPLGFSSLVFESLTSFQLDENFQLYNGYLLTKDRKHLLFFISPGSSSQETTKNAQLIDVIEGIGHHFQRSFNSCQFEYFGGPAISVANARRIKKDVTLTVSIALLSLFLLIGYYYGNWKIFFYILVPVILGTALALAIIGIIKPTISIIVIGVGSVLIGISIDFSIHLFTHYKKKGNIKEVIRDVSSPLLLSAITTSAAFLCLYFVRSEALHDLGLFSALSVLCVAFLALIVLPHFFDKSPSDLTSSTFIDPIAAFPYDRQKWLVITVLFLFVVCAFRATNVSFERDLNKINYMPEFLQKAEKNINEISDATKRGIYLISFGDDINKAFDISEQLVPILDGLKKEGKIESFSSPNTLISSENRQREKIKRWKQFWSKEKSDRIKQQIIAYSSTLKFKPETFNPFYALLEKDFSPMNPEELNAATGQLLKDYFTIREGAATCITMIRLEPNQKTHVHKAFSQMPHVSIIDKEYIVHQFTDTLKADFNKLVLLSLLAVLVILHLVYGRPELAWVAFLPICFSWTITLGMMNFFGIKFNIVNIIITSFIFGLGIDYSIFVLRGLLQNYKSGIDNMSSYKTSIILSSCTTFIGIGVLIFAQHPALRSIASISLIGIFSVLMVTFILQPLIFRWLIEEKGQRRPFPLTLSNMGKTLWVYFALIIGSVLLTMIGLAIHLLFFLPKETRKIYFHYCIYLASKVYIKSSFLNRITYMNPTNEDFKKPCLVLANHKSLIDTPLFFQLTPKIIIITNDWVSKFPLYRMVCRMADFHSISQGADGLLEKLEERVKNGYSIAVFPEGTRSRSEKLLRFKKGAFYLSEKLKLDIVPMFIHGTKPFLGKGKFWGRANNITLKIEERIPFEKQKFGADYSSYTKRFSHWFRAEYDKMRILHEGVDYHREEIIYNYIYKGPVTEWYARVKTKLEKNYKAFDDLIPEDAAIMDLGCGYGFMTYFLGKSQARRKFISVDYDENKINVAKNCAIRTAQMKFVHADILDFEFSDSDVFLLCDVVHYLKPAQQFQLLERCLAHLNPGGMIIIREGDKDFEKQHKRTILTEIFSTTSGFNKTRNALNFLSGNSLEKWAIEKRLNLRKVGMSKFTSNVIFVMENSKPSVNKTP